MRRVSLERDGDDYTLVVRVPVVLDFDKAGLRISPDQFASLASLTPTEHRVFGLLLHDKAEKEIASEIFRSVSTVKFKKAKIYKKLGCRNKYELMARFGARHPDDARMTSKGG